MLFFAGLLWMAIIVVNFSVIFICEFINVKFDFTILLDTSTIVFSFYCTFPPFEK